MMIHSEVEQMADINKITEVISMIAQILCFIAAVGTIVGGILFMVIDVPKEIVTERILINTCGMAITTVGLPYDQIIHVTGTGLILSGIIYGLLGMIFRNVNLIVRTAQGGTWFSKGETPFQDDVVRMVREIGIFCIGIFLVGLVGTSIIEFIAEDVEADNSILMLVIGIIMICLSKMFEYGKELQDAEDGLI